MQRHCLESLRPWTAFTSLVRIRIAAKQDRIYGHAFKNPLSFIRGWKGEGEGCVFLNLFFFLAFMFFWWRPMWNVARELRTRIATLALISCFHESRTFLWSIECRGPCLEAALFASYSRKCIFCFKTKPGTSISAIGVLPARIIWWHSPSEFPWRCSRAFPRDGICAELLA